MESSILSEVDHTSILRTGLPTPLCLSSQLATGLSPLAPRSGLERSDFVLWHRAGLSGGTLQVRYPALTRPSTDMVPSAADDPEPSTGEPLSSGTQRAM